MGQRISRAKAKLGSAGARFTIPAADDLPPRVDGVLTVLYLIFNEGYLSSTPDAPPIRRELTAEAIRLTRVIRDLLPESAEATGLRALMLLTEARSLARFSGEGELGRLDEQDRGAWDRALIAEGPQLIVSLNAAGVQQGRFALPAEINAVHVTAPHARDTDWARIVALYSHLEEIDPNPLVTLSRAVAVSEHDSPDVALAIVDRLADALGGFHAFHATRAELLRAIGLAGNSAEIAHLTRRRNQLAGPNGERS